MKLLVCLIFSSILPLQLSGFSADSIVNKDLVLINIANFSRDEITQLIIETEKQNPKVIGIDAWFSKEKEGDSLLLSTLNQFGNIVLAVSLTDCRKGKCDSIKGQYFPYPRQGHVIVNYRELNYYPYLKYEKKAYPFFCLALLQEYDSSLVENYFKKKIYKLPFTFYGNYHSFFTIEGKDILHKEPEKITLKDKIVIFAYLGEEIGKVKHPLMETDYKLSYISKGKLPDMYGAVMLANILTDIMKKAK